MKERILPFAKNEIPTGGRAQRPAYLSRPPEKIDRLEKHLAASPICGTLEPLDYFVALLQ